MELVPRMLILRIIVFKQHINILYGNCTYSLTTVNRICVISLKPYMVVFAVQIYEGNAYKRYKILHNHCTTKCSAVKSIKLNNKRSKKKPSLLNLTTFSISKYFTLEKLF